MSDIVADLRYLADSPSFTSFHSEDERAGICEKCNADFCYHEDGDASWCIYEALARAANEIERLRKQVADLQNPWIKADTTSPATFKPVLLCRQIGKGEYVVEQGMKDVGDWWKVYGRKTKRVTHWRPMPKLPPEIEEEIARGNQELHNKS